MPKDEELMGKLITVEITETGKHFMKCRLAKDGQVRRPEAVPPPLPKGQVSGLTPVSLLIIVLVNVVLSWYRNFVSRPIFHLEV